jgi:hypothetical protein
VTKTLVATPDPKHDWRAAMPLWAHMKLWRFQEWYPRETGFRLGEIESAVMIDPWQCIVHIVVLDDPMVRITIQSFHK